MNMPSRKGERYMCFVVIREDHRAEARLAPASEQLTIIQGRCPSCGSRGLFVGAGGFVTCSWLGCGEPDAASRLLEEGCAS